MRLIEATETPAHWDRQLKNAGNEASFLQTSFWGELLRRIEDSRLVYLTVEDEGDVIAAAQMLHRFPYSRAKGERIRDVKTVALGDHRGWIDMSAGPVFFDEKRKKDALGIILDRLGDYGRKKKITHVASDGFPPAGSYADSEELAEAFSSHGFRIGKWATYLVDLAPEEETLFGVMEHSSSKQIKKCQRMGISVDRITSWDDYLDRFYRPFVGTKGDAMSETVPLDTVRTTWDFPGSSDYYRYYTAFDADGRVMGVLGVFACNGVATEIMSALTETALAEKIPAQDILHWEIMLDMKRAGCHTFDLAGVNPEPKTPKEEGIRRFKKKWGGRYVEYFRYERRVTTGPVRRIASMIHR